MSRIDPEKARKIADAATRALGEAKERAARAAPPAPPPEFGGRDGPEPTRYGDWEKDGVVSDF